MDSLFLILLALVVATAIALLGYAVYHLNRMAEEDFDAREIK